MNGRTVALAPAEPITLKAEPESDYYEGDTEVERGVELKLV